jgi:hypothetical protein
VGQCGAVTREWRPRVGWSTASAMSRRRAIRMAVVVGVLVLVWAGRRESKIVSASDLVTHPARFSGKTFPFEGVWRTGFECSQLEISGSRLGYLVWVTADNGSISNANPSVFMQLKEILSSGKGRWEAGHRSVAVRFRGRCRFEARLPGRMDELLELGEHKLGLSFLGKLRTKPGDFGHLGSFPCELTLLSLDTVEECK